MVEAWRLRVCYCMVLAVQMQSVVFVRGHTMDQKLQSAVDTLWHDREMWSQQRRRRRRRVVLTKQACVVRREAGPARFRHKIRPPIPPTCLPVWPAQSSLLPTRANHISCVQGSTNRLLERHMSLAATEGSGRRGVGGGGNGRRKLIARNR